MFAYLAIKSEMLRAHVERLIAREINIGQFERIMEDGRYYAYFPETIVAAKLQWCGIDY